MPNSFEARYYGVELALVDRDLKKAQGRVRNSCCELPQGTRLRCSSPVQWSCRSGSLALAQTHLTQALQIAPNAPLARRLLAEADLRSGDTRKALDALQPLLEQSSPSAEALGLAAEAYLQDGNVAEAEKYYARAAKADPGDVKARVALALMQVAKGSAEAGFAQLESLAATDKTTYADLALISALVRSNDLPAALKAVDRLQGKMPDKPLPSLLRGRILLLEQGPGRCARELREGR